jgi:hypothetical protein
VLDVGEAELPDADRNQLLAEYVRTLADFHTVASDLMAGPTMIDIARTTPRAGEDAYLGARDVPSTDERRRDEANIRRRT